MNMIKENARQPTDSMSMNKVLHIESGRNHVKYFKNTYINGRHVTCYVDLGSSCVALRKDFVEEAGFTYLDGSFDRLTGYGDRSVTPLGLLTATLSIGGVAAMVRIHVVLENCQVIPLIVGHPFTEQSYVEIISRANELVIKELKNDLNSIAPEAKDRYCGQGKLRLFQTII